MNHTPRHAKILDILQSEGECPIEELAKIFRVSSMTVRRDLQSLAEQGRVIRTHGGAVLAPGVSFEFAFLRNIKEKQDQKRAIAKVAAGLINEGQSILLDSGTTTLAIAEELRGKAGLKVVTTSLPIASLLHYNEAIEIILLGGQLRPGSPDLSGALAQSNLDLISPDIAFLGADSIDRHGSVFSQSAELSQMLGKMISAANKVYIVADYSKLDKTDLWRFASLKSTAGLITDSNAPKPFIEELTRIGVNVMQSPKKRSK